MEKLLKIKDGNRLARVNFTNRGLSKVLNSNDSLADTTPDKQTVFSISEILSKAKIQKEEPTGFKTIPDFLGIDYVGYIIEKERLNKDTGEWTLIDEFKIIGAEANSFKDTRVAYGEFYRYRIRSIMKLTVKETKAIEIQSVENAKILQNKIKFANIEKNKSILQNIENVANLGVKSKVSSGMKPGEIHLSDDTAIHYDASSVSIVKKIAKGASENLPTKAQLISPKLTEKQLQTLLNAGIIDRLPKTKTDYVSYYYESDPSKNWLYFECVENIPPPPPSTIKIVPNTPQGAVGLYWLKPGNSQRDIFQYKVYKREKVGEKWTLLATLPEETNFFLDKDVVVDRRYIYAITCIDVHGIESFLSTQIEAGLNPQFALEKEERKLRWISGSGAKVSEVDFIFKKFHTFREQIIAKKNITLAVNTKFNDTKKNLIVRITSLDTHQQTELRLILKNVNTESVE